MSVIQLNGLQLTLDEKEECLVAKAADALGIPVAGIVYNDIAPNIDSRTTLDELERMVGHLAETGLMTIREAFLMTRLLELTYRCIPVPERTAMIRSLFAAMTGRD